MTADLSFVELISEASFIVQLVLLALLLASVASWAVIFQKRRALNDVRDETDTFEKRFWSGIELSALYKQVKEDEQAQTGMAGIFVAGFREYLRQVKQGERQAERVGEAARRAMHVAQLREIDRLENNLSFLATVGSTSPYVGLFGTVWGIMNAFRALGNVQQATLAMVAPGIAEALIATAMGLFAAIPAVIAYNRYADSVERLETRYDTFLEEFAAILQRNARQQ
ncbi:MAG TPA: protein TolQ [Gammaproteobacteria bacterium]